MIYYRDKVLNNLFEDKINSALNYISLNPSVGEDETLVDIAYKVYKDHEFNLLDNSNKNELEKQPSENNVGMPTEIEKVSNVVQAVEHN